MKPNPPVLTLLATFALAISAANAATIFSHDFSGSSTTNLNGTAVDVGTGNWVAASVFKQNGAVSGGSGSATLAFTPQQNTEYQLDARITGVTGNANWIALGFANGQSTGTTTNDRFVTNNVVGSAWMLFRGDNGTSLNTAFLGNGTLGSGNNGTTSGMEWSALNFQNGTTPGDIDLRILLDTTGGSGNWTVTWLAKRPTDSAYTVVRSTAAALDEANFTRVGFALSANGTQGTLESFTLTQIPEPSSAVLFGGLCMLLALRRRRH
jgi:hypothetical protein